MEQDDHRPSDEDIVKLAQAERDAGIPDVQTAASAAEAKARIDSGEDQVEEAEAHPS